MCAVFAAAAVVECLKEGAAGAGQGRYGQGAHGPRGRAPAQEAAHTEGNTESRVSEVSMKELNDLGHEPPQSAQQRLKVGRSPSVFVSPFCCS